MRLIDAEPLVKLLHSRCAQLSDDYGSLAGAVSGCLRLLQSQPTISALINEPLTQEELREMDGEPVWIRTKYDASKSFWAIVNTKGDQVESCARVELFEDYWSDWLAYRRKPEV